MAANFAAVESSSSDDVILQEEKENDLSEELSLMDIKDRENDEFKNLLVNALNVMIEQNSTLKKHIENYENILNYLENYFEKSSFIKQVKEVAQKAINVNNDSMKEYLDNFLDNINNDDDDDDHHHHHHHHQNAYTELPNRHCVEYRIFKNCDTSKFGLIIGSNGRNVQRMSRLYNVYFNIPPNTRVAKLWPHIIIVSNEANNHNLPVSNTDVCKAADEIRKILDS